MAMPLVGVSWLEFKPRQERQAVLVLGCKPRTEHELGKVEHDEQAAGLSARLELNEPPIPPEAGSEAAIVSQRKSRVRHPLARPPFEHPRMRLGARITSLSRMAGPYRP